MSDPAEKDSDIEFANSSAAADLHLVPDSDFHETYESLHPAIIPEEADEYSQYKKSVYHSKVEESESNWLVSYADLMTLLVGFFVLLQSFSKIDSNKYEKVKKETTKIFGGEYQIPFEKLTAKLKGEVHVQKLDSQVVFQESDAGVEVTFKGTLFFESGSTDLKDDAMILIRKFIPVIKDEAHDFQIVIEGHTDNRPLADKTQTNWELSSLRACTVLRMFLKEGFEASHLKAIGWGDTRPVVPNQDADGHDILENQSQNRRVVIKILKNFES